MSATNSSFNLPIENLILNYLKTGGNTIQLSVRAKDTATPITADIIRTTIYGLGSPEAQYFDNIQITGQIVLDGTIYADSQEQYWLTVRQQNPVSSLWSTCIVRLFSSKNGARVSIWLRWIEYNVSYTVPTTT